MQVVPDVEPYELMKLRLLNASHQALCYFGYLAGYRLVHEVAQDPLFADFLLAYMDREATPTLSPVPGIDLDGYKQQADRAVLQRRGARHGRPALRGELGPDPEVAAAGHPGEPRRRPRRHRSRPRWWPAGRATPRASDEDGEPIEVVDRMADRLTAIAQTSSATTRWPSWPTVSCSADLVDEPAFTEPYLATLDSLHSYGARATLEVWPPAPTEGDPPAPARRNARGGGRGDHRRPRPLSRRPLFRSSAVPVVGSAGGWRLGADPGSGENGPTMDKIGRYAIERRIGAGSFATVWLGHDDDLDVPVAVKVLAENWAANDDVRQRFLAEARIMRRIHDPRLVQVYDIGTLEDGRPYFVMDYIDGGSLNDLRKDGVEPVRALRLCAEACRALEVLHSNDIIHRDVTPGNLLVTAGPTGSTPGADRRPRGGQVDDRCRRGDDDRRHARPTWRPSRRPVWLQLDRRADIYSLTAVTYAMLTGRPPFPVTGISDILSRDPSRQPEPIADRLRAPASLDAVMISGLAFDRNRRPPTALLLADGLDTIARQLQSASSRPVAAPRSAPTPATASDATVGTMSGSPTSRPTPDRVPAYAPPPARPDQPVPVHAQFSPSHHPGSAGTMPSGPTSFGTPATAAYATAARPSVERQQARGAMYYVLLAVGGLALFALSMFVTILLLR